MANTKQVRAVGIVGLVVYAVSVFAANWLIRNVGIEIPGGNHLVPVGFGLMSPSGTYAAGVTFVARDVTYIAFGPDKNLPKVRRWLRELDTRPTLWAS